MMLSGSSAREDSRFMGKKARRRSSVYKRFLGDHLQLESNLSVLKLLAKEGDKKVTFSGVVVKINKRYKMQERVLMLTDKAIYNMTSSSSSVQRRIPYSELMSVSLSLYADNFVTLHCADERDYLLVTERKTELVVLLVEAVFQAQGKFMKVIFSNSHEWRIDGEPREVRFIQEENGILTMILNKKEGTTTRLVSEDSKA